LYDAINEDFPIPDKKKIKMVFVDAFDYGMEWDKTREAMKELVTLMRS
jgi:putative cell wall-binding protein